MVQKQAKRRAKIPAAEDQAAEPRRRGRPRAYDPETALAAAAEIFWNKGYDGTSLDDLAAATGMNRPSLYAAFGDKQTLYLKTLARYREEARIGSVGLLEDDPPLRVFLKRFYKGALNLYITRDGNARGCYTVGTAATQAVADPKVRAFLVESIRGTDEFLAEIIAKARDRGELPRSADPHALAQLASGTLHTLAVRARAGVPRKELDALAAVTVSTICGPEH
jgi:AcrR family transcriptional regulator